jgi:hypothetical protein
MTPKKSAVPDQFYWKFALTLVTALRAIKPRIVDITSISVTKISKRKKDGPYNYRVVVKGRQKVAFQDASVDFNGILEHREDCAWFPVGR